MKPFDFDTSLRRSPANGRRRRSLQRVLGTAGIALAIASCGSDTPVSTATPSTLAAPAPTRADNPPPTRADAAPPTTIADPPATIAAACRRLTDFDDSDFDGGWAVVNDGVMGGRSNGALEFTDSAMRFTGDVVTAGGGFTSVRLRLTGDELTDSGYLALRVRSDERTYGLTLQDSAQTGRRPIAHGANLTIDGPSDAEGWQTATTSYDELRPSVFGQSLDAPAFDPDHAVEIGIIISDGIDGPFELEVDWIDACSTRQPDTRSSPWLSGCPEMSHWRTTEIELRSDNAAGVAPEILAAVAAANMSAVLFAIWAVSGTILSFRRFQQVRRPTPEPS